MTTAKDDDERVIAQHEADRDLAAKDTLEDSKGQED